MSLPRWAAWTAACCIAAFALREAVSWGVVTVRVRDIGWVPGRFDGLAELIERASAGLEAATFLLAQVPALLWRRRGGGAAGTLAVAVAAPLAVAAPTLLPKGHPEDSFLPFIAAAIAILSLAAGGLICLVFRPRATEE